MDVDSEIAAAMKRIERGIDRRLHFAARSAGQKRRWAKHSLFPWGRPTPIVRTSAEFRARMENARVGEVIYVAGNWTIGTAKDWPMPNTSHEPS